VSLPWVRLESAFPQNPKILMLVEDRKWQAIAVYVSSLAYSGAHGSDGFIPRAALLYIHGRKTEAKHLVEVGLWIETAGGWDINGWHDFQPTSEEYQKRRDRAKRAAAIRWSKQEIS
jgi:hypothetical protein